MYIIVFTSDSQGYYRSCNVTSLQRLLMYILQPSIFIPIFGFHISRPKLMSSYKPLLSVRIAFESWKRKVFSGLWNVSVFRNAHERSSSSHYHQKTLLSIISKPFEATINHLNDLLSVKQYCFLSSWSTGNIFLLRIEIVKQLIIH